MSVACSIVGGSGFSGGELLRLLLRHPGARVAQVSSRRLAGEAVSAAHPNLRGHVAMDFCRPEEIGACDVLFLCMPHGEAAPQIDRWRALAPLVIDLSADFRLRSAGAYERAYERAHPRPELLEAAVYGLPEVGREAIRGASLVSGVGCNATAMILAMLPLARAGLIGRAICDLKVGSSEAGAEGGAGSHHAVRSRTARTYSASGHRHLTEVRQALGDVDVDATVTSVDMVRGVLCTAHVLPARRVDLKELWSLYRAAYRGEPFVRLVAERAGLNRFPDPRVLMGSNHADVGFAVDEASGRVIAVCAVDNLMKGAAGSALQAMNVALGFDEVAGLGFPGLHPA